MAHLRLPLRLAAFVFLMLRELRKGEICLEYLRRIVGSPLGTWPLATGT